jgi:hypothetical protein
MNSQCTKSVHWRGRALWSVDGVLGKCHGGVEIKGVCYPGMYSLVKVAKSRVLQKAQRPLYERKI